MQFVKKPMLKPSRQYLLQWCGWFFAGNIVLFWLIGLRYFSTIDWLFQEEYQKLLNVPDSIALVGYLLITYLGHLAILAFLPCLFITLLTLFVPNRTFIVITAVLTATICLCALVIDTIVFTLFHFHLNRLLFDLFVQILHTRQPGQDFLNLSFFEILIIIASVVSIFLLEIFFASWLKKRLVQKPFPNHFRTLITAFIGLCILGSYLVYVPSCIITLRAGGNADKSFGHTLIEGARILPFYHQILGNIISVKTSNIQNGQIALERISEHKFLQPNQASGPLNYPTNPLVFAQKNPKMNLLIIIIDAWRYDMLRPDITPALYQFSQKALQFTNHFSGGNSTGPGIHSLFYSIPATYWTAMREQQQGPVFINTLLEQHYQMNILASAGLVLPAFHRTVFQNVNELPLTTSGADAYIRDVNITEAFKTFLNTAQSKKQPFFSFLFYDSTHAYCQIKNNSTPHTPIIQECNRLSFTRETDPIPYLNRYKNTLLLVDAQIKQVLDSLEKYKLLDNTVVIISGDHGEEFNDNKLGFFGHTSNFTRYQLQTPLIIYWPGEQPKIYNHITTHYDIVPTLMEKLLGCQSPAYHYSTGNSLLAYKKYPFLIAGSYIGLGIIEPDRITTLYPTGEFQITNPNGTLIDNAKLRASVIQDAFQELKRFYVP